MSTIVAETLAWLEENPMETKAVYDEKRKAVEEVSVCVWVCVGVYVCVGVCVCVYGGGLVYRVM